MDAAKRLRKEIKEIRKESSQEQGEPEIVLHPNEDNILLWKAFIRGPRDSPFEHGSIRCMVFAHAGKLMRVGCSLQAFLS